MSNFREVYTKIFFMICVVTILVLIGILVFISVVKPDINFFASDNNIYDTDFCDNSCSDNVTSKYRKVPYTCEICGQTYSVGSSVTPKLCDSCANFTGKCIYCGKFLVSNK